MSMPAARILRGPQPLPGFFKIFGIVPMVSFYPEGGFPAKPEPEGVTPKKPRQTGQGEKQQEIDERQ